MTPHPHLKNAKRIAVLLDSQFNFLGFKFGLDSIIGLIPGFGDIVTLALASYLVWIGWQSQLPTSKMIKMISLLAADTLLGSVPILGDISDLFFKANLKNLQILEEHFASQVKAEEVVIEGEIVR